MTYAAVALTVNAELAALKSTDTCYQRQRLTNALAATLRCHSSLELHTCRKHSVPVQQLREYTFTQRLWKHGDHTWLPHHL